MELTIANILVMAGVFGLAIACIVAIRYQRSTEHARPKRKGE